MPPVIFTIFLRRVRKRAWCHVCAAGKLVSSGIGRRDVEVAMCRTDSRLRKAEDRRKREEEELQRYVEKVLADAPPLDEEQGELLREILGPSFRACLQKRRAAAR